MRLGWTAAARGKTVIDLLSALLIVVLLCSSAGLGMFISPRLPAAHRARETVEMMTLTIGMLVTFAALVLGLITASVKTGYDEAVHSRQEYALQLTELDRCLRNYGPGADAARAYLRSTQQRRLPAFGHPSHRRWECNIRTYPGCTTSSLPEKFPLMLT